MTQNLDDLYQEFEPIRTDATCAAWVEEYVEFRKPALAEASIAIIHRALILFALFCGRRPITGAIVHGYVAERFSKNQNANTRARDTYWLKIFLNWCHEMGYLKERLALLVPTVAIPDADPVVFTVEQYEALKEATKGTPWHYATIMAYRTGARLSDVCLMKWNYIDFESLLIRYVPFKTRRKCQRQAICPFQSGGDLHEMLLDLNRSRRCGPDGYISSFLAERYLTQKKPLGNVLAFRFVAICESIGIRGRSFHNLRNSFMSRAVGSGASHNHTMQITGLRGQEHLLRYAKPDLGALRSTIDRMDSIENAPDPSTTIIAMPKESSAI